MDHHILFVCFVCIKDVIFKIWRVGVSKQKLNLKKIMLKMVTGKSLTFYYREFQKALPDFLLKSIWADRVRNMKQLLQLFLCFSVIYLFPHPLGPYFLSSLGHICILKPCSPLYNHISYTTFLASTYLKIYNTISYLISIPIVFNTHINIHMFIFQKPVYVLHLYKLKSNNNLRRDQNYDYARV